MQNLLIMLFTCVGMMGSMIQDSPPGNMGDDGHTMSSDMSGPITIPTARELDSSTIRQLQQLQQILIRQTGSDATGGGGSGAGASTSGIGQDSVKFNKKLLDYDYGEDEEDDKQSPRNPNNADVISCYFIYFSFSNINLFWFFFLSK